MSALAIVENQVADAAPAGSVQVPDSGGIDDEVGQSDLTSLFLGGGDYGWTWDELVSGGDNQQVCIYLQTPGGATIYAVCLDYAVNANTFIVEVRECVGTFNGLDKCTGGTSQNNPITTDFTATCTLNGAVPAVFAADPDDDFEAFCDLSNPTLELLNVCSKPGISPSSNSKDCIFAQQPGQLQLVKEVATGTATPSDFTLFAGNISAPGASLADAQIFPVLAGTAFDLSESDVAGYALSSLTCSTTGNTEITSVVIPAGTSVVCTFVNSLAVADLTLVKQVTNDNGGLADGTEWTLTADGADTNDLTGPTGVTGSVLAGDFTLSESGGPATYTQTSVECVDTVAGPLTLTADVLTLAAGQNVTCTFVNDDNAPSLTLVKQVTNNNGGTAQPGDFTLTATGYNPAAPTAGTFALSETGPAGYTLTSLTCDNAQGQVTSATVALGENVTCTFVNDDNAPSLTLVKQVTNDNGGTAQPGDFTLTATGYNPGAPNAGTFALSETGPAGYTLTSLTCDNAQGQVASVTVALGENVTCTFVNDDVGPLLTLVKTVVNNNGGTAADTEWTLDAAGYDSGNPQAGTYTLSETGGPSGYALVMLGCDNVAGPVTEVTLGVGDDVTCTFVNDDVGPGLTLVKQVTNNSGGTAQPGDFTLTATGYNPADPQAGTYALSETGPAGYTLTSLTCDNAQGQVADVTIAVGESVVCTFVNNDDAPLLRLIKQVTNDNGGTANGSEWTLTATGYNPADPQAGTYSLSESGGPAGYTQTSLTCSNANGQVTEVTLGVGDIVDCRFINDDNAPSLTLVKQVDNALGGTAVPSDWALTATGYSAADPQAGTYALSESAGPAGYSLTSLTCSNAVGPVTSVILGIGDDVTCTFVNTNDGPSSISVSKTATPSQVFEPGAPVVYDFVVTNTSLNDTVTITSLADSIYGGLEAAVGSTCTLPQTLAPNASYSCSLSTTVVGNFGDVITNVLTVGGTDDDGGPVGGEDSAEVRILDVASAITVTKTANPTSVPEPGGPVTFTFATTNDSSVDTVTINSMVDTVFGDLNGQGDCSVPQVLAPNASYSCSLVQNITGNAGDQHANTVAIAGIDDDDQTVGATDDATVDITNVPSSLLVTKDASLAQVPESGADVTFTIVVTNSSAVDVVTVNTIIDDVFGDISADCSPVLPVDLNPGDSINCSFTRTITGSPTADHHNVVTATGIDDDGTPVTGHDDALIDILSAQLAVDKVFVQWQDVDLSTTATEGDILVFDIIATNLGDADLHNVVVTDSLTGDTTTCAGPIATGAQCPLAGVTYTLLQSDIDNGEIINTGTADSDETPEDTDDERVPLEAAPAISLVKTLTGHDDTNADSVIDLGETLTYTLTAKNDGNVTLDPVLVSDALTGTVNAACSPSAIDPGDSCTATVSYTVTQADLDRGNIVNEATATGQPPSGDPVDDTDDLQVPLVPTPSIDLVKTGSIVSAAAVVMPGDLIMFGFTATNNGNVTLHEVVLDDPLPGLSNLTCDWASSSDALTPDETLSVGETVDCSADYTIEEADIARGFVENQALSTGKTPDEQDVTDNDTVRVPVPIISAIQLTITPDVTTIQVGGTITYTLVATNNSNVTLHDVLIDDPLPGLSPLICVGPGTSQTASLVAATDSSSLVEAAEPVINGSVTLAPGESLTCTATYVTSANDIPPGASEGTLLNPGTTNGIDPTEVRVQADDNADVVVTSAAITFPAPLGVPVPEEAAPPAPDEVLGVVETPPLAITGSNARQTATAGLALVLSGLCLVAVGKTTRRREDND